MGNDNLTIEGSVTYKEQRAKEQLKIIDTKDAIVSIFTNTGIAGFKFHCPQSEQVNMESDITDHYTDINSAVQDHIARKPITITLSGYQGEYYYTVHPIENMLSKIAPIFTLVEVFKPKISDVTKLIKARKNEQPLLELKEDGTVSKTYRNKIIDKEFNAIDLFNLFQSIYKFKSAQTRAFLYFEALWRSEILFSIETRWKRYDNMVIQKVTPLGDNNADITEFSVTFKQMGVTTSKSERVKTVAGRLKEQAAQVTNKGIDKGKEVDTLNPNKNNFKGTGASGSW